MIETDSKTSKRAIPGRGHNPIISHKRKLLLLVGLAGAAWAGLGGLIFLLNVGDYDFWFPGRIMAYVLLLIAPALTFMPIGQALEFHFYGYWAVMSWAIFGYTLAFVPTEPELGWNANTGAVGVMLISLFMVVVTVSLPLFYRLGFRLFSRKVEQYDLGRARREAVLMGAYVLLIAFLRIVGAATLLNGVTLLLAFIVLELLILTRNVGRW
jgi:hypothetical protein